MTEEIKEEWRPIEGFSKYEVSNTGKVRNIKSGRILAPGLNNYSYQLVCLTNDQKEKKCRLVHRLVALSFIENPNPQLLTDVNHIDQIRTNNSLDNLEWVSHFENSLQRNTDGELRDLKKTLRRIFEKIMCSANEEELNNIYINLREKNIIKQFNV